MSTRSDPGGVKAHYRYLRQLPIVGGPAQERILATSHTCAAPHALGALVEALYVAGAGAAVVVPSDEIAGKVRAYNPTVITSRGAGQPDGSAAGPLGAVEVALRGIADESARSAAEGAIRAILALKRAMAEPSG